MIVPKLIIAQLLLTAISCVKADRSDGHIRSTVGGVTDNVERDLGHKSWKKLYAEITDKHEELEDVGGSIQLAYNDDGDFDVSYHLHDLPEYCDTCYIAIIDKGSCKGSLDEDDHHFDRRLHYDDDDHDDHDDDDSSDPFGEDLTDFITNEDGDAIGGLLGVKNGYSQNKNRCKVAVVWAEVEEEDSSSKSAKSHKSKKYHRNLVRTTHEYDRVSRRMKKVMRVVGCGVLKKKGDEDDC